MLNSNQVVLTLDAGGTNFSFNAVKNGEVLFENFDIRVNTDDLDECLNSLILGFESMKAKTSDNVSAISFAFPGPADYKNGIIYNDGNLKAFKKPVALGKFLENHFRVPVFINNDGDLFTYGEARSGFLPEVNHYLKDTGTKFNSLIGLTLGTGFGGGAYINNTLMSGENSCAMEVWLTRSGLNTNVYAEENISKRAITNFYGAHDLTPYDIYKIALGEVSGDKVKANDAFTHYGRALGESIANLAMIFDAPIVLGGGIKRAYSLLKPAIFEVLNGSILDVNGNTRKRIVHEVIDFESDKEKLLVNSQQTAFIPKTIETINFNPAKKIIIGLSKIGTNKSTNLGAYYYAVDQLNRR